MPKHLSLLLVSTVLLACSGQPPDAPEVPVQPLVVGTSAPQPVDSAPSPAREAPIAIAPTTPLAVPARDPRLARPPRSNALVQTELQGLEQLFVAAAAGAPDRALLLRRLADDYAELSRAGDPAVATTAHKQAMKYYDLAIAETKQHPPQRGLDETYYYAALEHEMAGDFRQTRIDLYEVIKQFPQSRLIPLAYFGFGELFITEADSDPSKLDLAEQAYLEVLKYPAATNPVFADAQSRRQEIKDRKSSAAKIRRP